MRLVVIFLFFFHALLQLLHFTLFFIVFVAHVALATNIRHHCCISVWCPAPTFLPTFPSIRHVNKLCFLCDLGSLVLHSSGASMKKNLHTSPWRWKWSSACILAGLKSIQAYFPSRHGNDSHSHAELRHLRWVETLTVCQQQLLIIMWKEIKQNQRHPSSFWNFSFSFARRACHRTLQADWGIS